VVAPCNGETIDTLLPSTELHIMEPTEGIVLTDSVPVPSQCTPSQPVRLCGATEAQVRLQGISEFLFHLLNSGVQGYMEGNIKVRDCGIIRRKD